jgi:hypothetical protein
MSVWGRKVYGVILILAVALAGISGYFIGFRPGQQGQLEPVSPSTLEVDPIDLSSIQAGLGFIKYYSLSPLDLGLKVSQYDLPLQTEEISNFNDFSTKISLSKDALTLLEKNGFVVISNPFNGREEYITQPYKTLKEGEVPIFITSDSLLHLYHIQFDETLRKIEEGEFYDKIWAISKELLDYSIEKHSSATGDFKEASKRNVAYFSVNLELLKPKEDQLCDLTEWECEDPGLASVYFREEDLKKYDFDVPEFVRGDVERELELIEKHEGFSNSPIFIYMEDYSQYVPRGHYTRSEKLKNYFRAFMWTGRMSMLLKGSDGIPVGRSDPFNPEALISTYDAKVQTMQAGLIAYKFAESRELGEKWDRIYSVTSFYVGLSDDLGPYEYLEALKSVFEGKFDLNGLEENIGKLKAKLAEYRSPKIFGGTGDCGVNPPFTPEQADQCLEKTKGFRLMGQRFIPDSYMFSNLVGAYTGVYMGDEEPFTLVISGAGRPIRGFPRGLDVMALLGSSRAKELLNDLDDSNYGNYTMQYLKLEEEFNSFKAEDWNRNLYWSWLYSLKPLLKEFGEGYPTFMQTKAWQDKELTTALTSWTELRHDTILYAKQSYTMVESAIPSPPPEKPVVGYVEPVPEFYNRLLALTRMTNKGLLEMEVLDEASKSRLQGLEKILERLVKISEKELENGELTKEDYDFIKNFGDELNDVIADVDEKAKKTTIIADVHTDGNTGQVLEEGVGYVDLIVVAYKVPDGRILIGSGPIMTYYEFKHPMQDRLTDEEWRGILNSKPPEKPEWTSNFALDSS